MAEEKEGWVEVTLGSEAAPKVETVVVPSEEPAPTTSSTESEVPKGIDKRIRKALDKATKAEHLAAAREAEIADLRKQLEERNRDADRRENAAVSTFKTGIEAKMAAAEKQFADAYKSGDDQALVAAQREMNRAQTELYNLEQWERTQANKPAAAPAARQVPSAPATAPGLPQAAIDWCNEHPWFGTGPGKDEVATRLAAAISDEILRSGDFESDDPEFYKEVTKRLIEESPRAARLIQGSDARQSEQPRQPRSPVAAPSRRTPGSGKVRISDRQEAMAGRLGLGTEDYAYQQQVIDTLKDDAGYTPIRVLPRKR
jgi:hypothetical protein